MGKDSMFHMFVHEDEWIILSCNTMFPCNAAFDLGTLIQFEPQKADKHIRFFVVFVTLPFGSQTWQWNTFDHGTNHSRSKIVRRADVSTYHDNNSETVESNQFGNDGAHGCEFDSLVALCNFVRFCSPISLLKFGFHNLSSFSLT